jgi:hypothetical protein
MVDSACLELVHETVGARRAIASQLEPSRCEPCDPAEDVGFPVGSASAIQRFTTSDPGARVSGATWADRRVEA